MKRTGVELRIFIIGCYTVALDLIWSLFIITEGNVKQRHNYAVKFSAEGIRPGDSLSPINIRNEKSCKRILIRE